MKHDDRVGWALLVVAGFFLAFVCARVLAPYLTSLLAAAVVAVALDPLHERLVRKWPRRSGPLAALVTAGFVILAVVPALAATAFLIKQAVEGLPALRDRIASFSPRYLEGQRLKDLALLHLSELGPWLGRAVDAAGNAAGLFLDALVFAVTLALLLKHGREACARLIAVLPVGEKAKDRFVARVRDLIVRSAQGVFFGALVQGVVATAGFALFGVPFPFLLGTLCAAFSPLPFVGAGLVWIPVAASIGLTGHPLRAGLMAAWFVVLIGVADHVLRPMYVGARAGMPAALAIVGILGGASAYGFVGALIGPVVLAAAAASFEAFLPLEGYGGGA